MKAVDYFKKYGDQIRTEAAENSGTVALRAMLLELAFEGADLAAARKVKSNSGTVAVFKEINQKYNVICKLLGGDVLKRDGFKTYVQTVVLPNEDWSCWK